MSKIVREFKENVYTFFDLPISGNEYGDVRLVKDVGIQFYWSLITSSGEYFDWISINAPVVYEFNGTGGGTGGGSGDQESDEVASRMWMGIDGV